MDANEIAAKGIIVLGVCSVVAGAILAGMGKADAVITIFVVIGSNALSALAGYMTAKKSEGTTAPNEPAEKSAQ